MNNLDRYLFRGISEEKRAWAYGSLFVQKTAGGDFVYICPWYGDHKNCEIEVIPETVGIWTGTVDLNGVKCFEGDKLTGEMDDEANLYDLEDSVITYDDFKCEFFAGEGYKKYEFRYCFKKEVVGSIHDHLLKENI